jgi:PIN domain nuclease of toxin-antitoxin system
MCVSAVYALPVAGLPTHHSHPFDRLLVAQAQVEDLTLAAVDPLMQRYHGLYTMV